MKVLIVGAKGMLGQALCEAFSDFEVVAWDREEIDITKHDEVIEKILGLKPDLLINAAAYTNVDGAETEKELAFAVNAEGVRNLAEAAKNLDIPLVQYSTDYIFSGDNKDGYREDATRGPAVNVYGESKLAGEQALQEIAPRFYILRTAWLYGKGGKNFVDTIAGLAQTKPEVTVVNDQFGSPTYTKDLAKMTREIVTGDYEGGIYHTTNSGIASWYDFACAIVKNLGLQAKIVPVTSDQYPRPAKRPQYSILINTKGPNMRPWQEALEDYLESKGNIQ